MAEQEYQRLTRAKQRTAFAIISTVRSSLWLGKDHLLRIDTTGYTENYKRFYFRDIQAIIMRKTDRGKILNLALVAVSAIFTLFAGLASSIEARWILGSISALFLLPLILNVAAGATSVCHLRTAVQTEELPLTRLRKARQALTRLRPFIAQAQGQLAPEEISARLRPPAEPAIGPMESREDRPENIEQDPNVPPRITP